MLFSEIIGHNELKNKLIETVNSGRISHTLLFYGQEGGESLSIAIAYAQYIACSNKQKLKDDELIGDSCGQCPSCKKYQNLAHPDLHFIFPVATTKEVNSKPTSADFINPFRQIVLDNKGYLTENEWYSFIGIENKQGRISVDDANEINQIASTTPYESPQKVVIIWLAEKLYHAAAPKLLKTLEEPPQNTLFFLISYNPDQLLKTILSRTQMIKVSRHPEHKLKDYLADYFGLEGDRLEYVLKLSDGNFNQVFSLLENNQTDSELLTDFRELMLLCYGFQIVKIKEKCNTLSGFGREKLKQFLSYGLRIIRLCVMFETGQSELIKATKLEEAFVSKFSSFVNRKNAQQFSEIIELAIKHIERNGNSKIILMDMSLQIATIFAKDKNKKGN